MPKFVEDRARCLSNGLSRVRHQHLDNGLGPLSTDSICGVHDVFANTVIGVVHGGGERLRCAITADIRQRFDGSATHASILVEEGAQQIGQCTLATRTKGSDGLLSDTGVAIEECTRVRRNLAGGGPVRKSDDSDHSQRQPTCTP